MDQPEDAHQQKQCIRTEIIKAVKTAFENFHSRDYQNVIDIEALVGVTVNNKNVYLVSVCESMTINSGPVIKLESSAEVSNASKSMDYSHTELDLQSDKMPCDQHHSRVSNTSAAVYTSPTLVTVISEQKSPTRLKTYGSKKPAILVKSLNTQFSSPVKHSDEAESSLSGSSGFSKAKLKDGVQLVDIRPNTKDSQFKSCDFVLVKSEPDESTTIDGNSNAAELPGQSIQCHDVVSTPRLNKARVTFSDTIETNSENSTGKIFQCEKCGQQFTRLFNLERHMNSHKSFDYIDGMDCNICGDKYTSPYQMKKHLERHNTEIVTPDNAEHLECKTCQDIFETRDDYFKHMCIFRKTKIIKDYTKSSSSRSPTNMSSHSAVLYHRLHRSAKILMKSTISKPQQPKSVGQQILCHLCSKMFKEKRYLREHSKQCHFQEDHIDRLRCPKCNKQYLHRSSLYCHTKKCGNNDQP